MWNELLITGCHMISFAVFGGPSVRYRLTLNVLRGTGERVSMELNGIFMATYQICFAESMRVTCSKPEFHTHPFSWCAWFRSISRSTHSLCGETSNSLYLLMSLKSDPMNISATFQFHNSLVS